MISFIFFSQEKFSSTNSLPFLAIFSRVSLFQIFCKIIVFQTSGSSLSKTFLLFVREIHSSQIFVERIGFHIAKAFKTFNFNQLQLKSGTIKIRLLLK